jgi:hypothetical protein
VQGVGPRFGRDQRVITGVNCAGDGFLVHGWYSSDEIL